MLRVVKIIKTTYDVEMASEKKVNLGVWQGAKIRPALNSAIARRYCDNIQYEKCDMCNIETCMNKYMFMFKSDGKTYHIFSYSNIIGKLRHEQH